MNTHWNNGEIKRLIAKYEDGATTSTEESRLFAYFLTDEVAEDFHKEQTYFCSLNELKIKQTFLSFSDEKRVDIPKKRYSLAYFARLTAVAASVALVVMAGAYLQIKPKDYVLIDGKKYTDKETMEQVFTASMQNVKQSTQELFSDLGDVLQW